MPFGEAGHWLTCLNKLFFIKYKNIKNSKTTKEKKKILSQLGSFHGKPLYYGGTIFLTKYAHLHKTGVWNRLPQVSRTLLPTTSHGHLWLHGICYSIIILTLKSICRGTNDLPLQIHFKGRVFFHFILKIHLNL